MQNSIFEQSSYSEIELSKKKKFWNLSSIQRTRVHVTQVPLEYSSTNINIYIYIYIFKFQFAITRLSKI